jgi:hypothetical protein
VLSAVLWLIAGSTLLFLQDVPKRVDKAAQRVMNRIANRSWWVRSLVFGAMLLFAFAALAFLLFLGFLAGSYLDRSFPLP